MILITLGSNLPFGRRMPRDILDAALRAVARMVTVEAISRYYTSPAWPNGDDPAFVNAAARIDTGMPAEALLSALHAIEAGFGRRRGAPNAPRTLDLDLIAYDDRVRQADTASALVLPHPAVADRDFALAPLAEVAPDWRHPVTGLGAEAMLAALKPHSAVPIEENR